MGGGIGSALHQSGIEVLTCLAGRGDLTRTRAQEGGFEDVPDYDTLVQRVDLLLSVLVPGEAQSIADVVAQSLRRTGARPVYVECNAIAPHTVLAIQEKLGDAVGGFIDVGIIGSPPRRPNDGTHLYCSGPNTEPFQSLAEFGLDVRPVGPEVGQASGLKMVYAATTKGTTALWTELLVAARALNLEGALRAELGEKNQIANHMFGNIPTMPRRSRRWVAEMEEIASTFESLGLTPRMLQGAADIYRFVGGTPLGDQTSREPDPTLDTVLETLAKQLPRAE